MADDEDRDGREFAGGWLHTEVGRQVRPVVRARRLSGMLRGWLAGARRALSRRRDA